MKETFISFVKNQKQASIDYLQALTTIESMDLGPTTAQKMVHETMISLGLEIDEFDTDADHLKELDDYCPNNQPFHPETKNLIGYTPYKEGLPSLLVFAHIDTERHDHIGCHIEGDRLVGLGSADDKGGIATMLLALKYYKDYYGCLPYNLILMSVIGKRGGVGGTLIGCDRLKYTPDAGIYLHPAETGLGLNELKNISLGVLDFKLETFGSLGAPHVDLDPGISANHQLIVLASALVELNQKRLNQYGNKDEFGTKLNIGTIEGGKATGNISQHASCMLRVHFGKSETMQEVEDKVRACLDEAMAKHPHLFKDHAYTLSKGYLRASFAMMEKNHPLLDLLRNQITSLTGIEDFIYQAHGASDIRLPMVLKGIPTLGIGCLCYLPTDEDKHLEWIDLNDYQSCIEVMATTIDSWCQMNKDETV
ncbi:MAG: M20/M25/M40 family metallo-hydrolase [Erysipelotrichaceae bacterium]